MAAGAAQSVEPSGQPPEPTGTPPGAPEATPAAPQQGGSEGEKPQAPAQPGGSGQLGAGVAEPEPHVPWPKWRALTREYTGARREWETKEQTYQRELAEARQRAEGLSTYEKNYRSLEAALRAHPDIAEALAARLGGTPAPAGTPGQVALPPEVLGRLGKLDKLDDILARFERADQMRAQQAEQQADQQLSRQLDESIGKLLAPKQVKASFAPMVRAYVLQRVNQPDMEGATLEDVPYLVDEWVRAFRGAINEEIEALRSGVKHDQRLPAPAGGTAPAPVGQKRQMGANDETTAKILEQEFAERLGWNNNGDEKAAGA